MTVLWFLASGIAAVIGLVGSVILMELRLSGGGTASPTIPLMIAALGLAGLFALAITKGMLT